MPLLPVLAKRLQEKHVEIRADEAAYALIPGAVHATEEDWGKEYLDYILSIKVVSSVERRSLTSINIIRNIQRQLLPIIMNMHRSFWMKWMLRQFMSMPPHVYRWIWIRFRGRDRYQHTEASCERTYGTRGADYNKIYYIWKRSDQKIIIAVKTKKRVRLLLRA